MIPTYLLPVWWLESLCPKVNWQIALVGWTLRWQFKLSVSRFGHVISLSSPSRCPNSLEVWQSVTRGLGVHFDQCLPLFPLSGMLTSVAVSSFDPLFICPVYLTGFRLPFLQTPANECTILSGDSPWPQLLTKHNAQHHLILCPKTPGPWSHCPDNGSPLTHVRF